MARADALFVLFQLVRTGTDRVQEVGGAVLDDLELLFSEDRCKVGVRRFADGLDLMRADLLSLLDRLDQRLDHRIRSF